MSWDNHFLVFSSLRYIDKVASFSWSGRHCLRASRALEDAEVGNKHRTTLTLEHVDIDTQKQTHTGPIKADIDSQSMQYLVHEIGSTVAVGIYSHDKELNVCR